MSLDYKLVGKKDDNHSTIINLGDVSIGGDSFAVIAGPCAVENETQLMESANILKKLDLKIMRASAFKPRTSPYSFQGLGIEGLKLLKKVKEETGLLVETEVMDVRYVKTATEYVDILRVGSRNMHNMDLLKEMGKINKPVILKRGMASTIEELLMAAEYIMIEGNKDVILCERGIRTFETTYRNVLDINAIPTLKKKTHLPVIVDPSHASGNRDLVPPLSKAAMIAGADGIIVEMHPDPESALSDGAQSLYPNQLENLLKDLKNLSSVVNKNF